jgi:hypothetical protein
MARAVKTTTIITVFANAGWIQLRSLRGGGYAIRLTPEDAPATDMLLSAAQLRLLRRHVDELLREAA